MRIGIDVSMLGVRGGRHGTGSYLRGLIGALAARPPAHELTLLGDASTEAELPPLPAEIRFRALPGRALGRGRALVSHQLALPRLAGRLRLDVLHVPGVSINASMPGIPLRCPVPVVVTVHDLMPLLFPDAVLPRRRHRLFYRLMLRACAAAARLICDSDATRRDVLAHLRVPAERLSVVALAADPSFSCAPAPAGDARAEALAGRRFVLHIGGAAPLKNLAGLLGAAAARWTAGRLADVDVVAVTSLGLDPAALCPAAAPHRHRVHVLEDVAPAFLRWLYQRALCAAVPSLYEGFGLPVLEAMASGCPVVASRVGSLPEVGGSAALYVEPGCATALGDALEALAAEPGRRRAARESGLRRAAEFSWDRTAVGTVAAYEAAGRR